MCRCAYVHLHHQSCVAVACQELRLAAGALPRLLSLNVSHNRLHRLPPTLASLPSLTSLSVAGNPFVDDWVNDVAGLPHSPIKPPPSLSPSIAAPNVRSPFPMHSPRSRRSPTSAGAASHAHSSFRHDGLRGAGLTSQSGPSHDSAAVASAHASALTGTLSTSGDADAVAAHGSSTATATASTTVDVPVAADGADVEGYEDAVAAIAAASAAISKTAGKI